MPTEVGLNLAQLAGSEDVAELLASLCDVSGLGFALIAAVTEQHWSACAVLDRIQMGVVPGQSLDESTAFSAEICRTRKSVIIDHASNDSRYRRSPVPQQYGFQSYISVPIVLQSGEYLGNLCGIDRRPLYVSDPRIQLMFHCYARLIAQHVDAHATRQPKRLAPLNRHIVGNLRGLFVAMLGRPPGDAVTSGDLPVAAAAPLAADPALRQLAARVVNEPHRLTALINDVLAYARGLLNGGMPGYIWKVDDLQARLKAVVADTMAANPSRTIITNIAFDHPVDCDPALIQELAGNLLRNALTHGAPAGPVSFVVSTHDNHLEIAVWNDGNVIPQQALRTVFTPAFRPGSDPAGARLGLCTCVKIVRAHLGTIGVTSSPSEGTQFVARIPVARSLRLH